MISLLALVAIVIVIVGLAIGIVILEAFKLLIIALISIPLYTIYTKYVGSYLKLDHRVSIILGALLTVITDYILYQNWLLIIVGSIIIGIIYIILEKYVKPKISWYEKLINEVFGIGK